MGAADRVENSGETISFGRLSFFLPLVKFSPFPTAVSVETDASVAKQCCSVGYAVKRRIEEMTRTHRLMHEAVTSLAYVLVQFRLTQFFASFATKINSIFS